MFKRLRLTVFAAAASSLATSCVSDRGRYDFSYDCTNVDVQKAALDTWNTKIYTYGNGKPVNDPDARKVLDRDTKLGAVRTLGKNEHGYLCGTLVQVPSFYNKALKGRVEEAKVEYFYNVRLTDDGGFVVDGRQGAWFHLDRPQASDGSDR